MAVTTSEQAQTARPARMIQSLNPSSGEVLGTVPDQGPEEVRAAVARARAAFSTWSALTHGDRRDLLIAFRRQLASRCDEIADLIHRENGKPRIDALMEVMMSLGHLSYAANRAERAMRRRKVSAGILANFRAEVSYHPLGVVGVIGPWNYPMFTPFGSITYALAAGNAVVFKPSELTPLVACLLADIARESLEVGNVFQCVTGRGETGAALVRADIDKIAFTGSAATGRRVMAAAAEKLTPVLMELGGKDPLIVCEDADVDKAAEAAVYGALTNAGQACISVERVYVADAVYDRFVEKVVAEVQQVRVGSDEEAHIGAITRPEQMAIIRDHIKDAVDKGAVVLVGGPDASDGSFFRPTVLTNVTANMKILSEETFGPVVPVVRVRDAEEAVRLANESRYGLGSAIFGKANVRRLAERIRAGMTSVNAVLAYAAIPTLPFGGLGESGFGRIHGDEGIREFTRIKSTAEERFALPISLLSFKLPKGTYARLRTMVHHLYGGGVVDRAGAALHKFL